MSPVDVEQLKYLGSQARLVDMSRCPDFNDHFLNNLYLQSMGGE
jgi:hypothetical protein